jgi:hypothetical protein
MERTIKCFGALVAAMTLMCMAASNARASIVATDGSTTWNIQVLASSSDGLAFDSYAGSEDTSVSFASASSQDGASGGMHPDAGPPPPVPEPMTLIAGVLLLLPFGASTLRILRRNRAA